MNEIGTKIDAREIAKQSRNLDPKELMALLKQDISVFFSWGSHNFTIDNAKDCRMFRMNVQGHHHTGHVYIFVNGMDLFDVYYTSNRGTIKDVDKDLYFDQLVEVIDNKIERVEAYK